MSTDFLLKVFTFSVLANVFLFPFIRRSRFIAKLWLYNLVIGILLIMYLLKTGTFSAR